MKTPKLNRKVARHFLVKCSVNRGGRYLVPISVQEVRMTPDDPVLEYHGHSDPSPYLGEIRDTLARRGDLVTLADGSDRITRTPHVGKEVRPGRNGKVFVLFTVNVPEWLKFTRRTNEPKLSWLEARCASEGLRMVRQGYSWHAPVTYVHRDDHRAAWEILGPVDDVPDDAPQFVRWAEDNGTPTEAV